VFFRGSFALVAFALFTMKDASKKSSQSDYSRTRGRGGFVTTGLDTENVYGLVFSLHSFEY
jgi:hypothetical protein